MAFHVRWSGDRVHDLDDLADRKFVYEQVLSTLEFMDRRPEPMRSSAVALITDEHHIRDREWTTRWQGQTRMGSQQAKTGRM